VTINLAGHLFDERDLIGRVMRHATPAKGKHSGEPRWAWVSCTFAVGSTVARALCREHGMDPDERVKKS